MIQKESSTSKRRDQDVVKMWSVCGPMFGNFRLL